MTSSTSSAQAQRPNAGKIYKIVKILGRMNSRTVMMERFQDAEFSWHCCPQKTVTIPRSVCVLYLLFTQPSIICSFHSSDPCFSVSCPKGVGYSRVYCTNFKHFYSPPSDKETKDIYIPCQYNQVIIQCPTNRLSGRPGQPKTFTDNWLIGV